MYLRVTPWVLYCNDLPSALQDTMADIYDDDTTNSYSTGYKEAPQTASDSLQSDLNRVQKWSDYNKMILNVKRSKAMLATGKWFKIKLGHEQLQVNIMLLNR